MPGLLAVSVQLLLCLLVRVRVRMHGRCWLAGWLALQAAWRRARRRTASAPSRTWPRAHAARWAKQSSVQQHTRPAAVRT